MNRMMAGVFALVLATASPALAQGIGGQIDSLGANANIDVEAASATDIDAALTEDLQALIAVELGVADLDEATDEQVAAALQTILTDNPDLSTAKVTALVRAAARAKPGAAALIASAAATARPDLAAAIIAAATSVNPALAAEINAAVVQAVALALGISEQDAETLIAGENPNQDVEQDASPT